MRDRDELLKLGVLLYGPIVPKTFVDNGCSAPLPKRLSDGWWRWACRIHDYEYSLCKNLPKKSKEWRDARYRADKNLQLNIIKMTFGWRKFFIRILARIYFRAVRIFGGRHA